MAERILIAVCMFLSFACSPVWQARLLGEGWGVLRLPECWQTDLVAEPGMNHEMCYREVWECDDGRHFLTGIVACREEIYAPVFMAEHSERTPQVPDTRNRKAASLQ